jgi:pyruvate formate lyase activating enzyme
MTARLADDLQGPFHPGRWWHRLDDGRIQCDLCPRDCRLHEGQRGACFVRARVGDAMVLTTYGRSSGFCVDPIEKKPLNHFLPGSAVFSFGTAGCNLACKFCFHPATWIATSDGMRRIGALFEDCSGRAPLGEGSAGFPDGVEVWTRHSERTAVTKVFSRPYDGEMVSLRAACCPPIQATPNHGIFAAHRSDLAAIRKIPAGELTTDHYLVVPKRKASTADVTVSARQWLGRLDVQPHAARLRRVEPGQLVDLLQMDGTSTDIASTLGYHPAYVRKLRGQLARRVLAPCDEPRDVTLTARDGRLRFLGEKGPGVPESLVLTPDLAWLLGIFCAEGAITSHPARPNSFRLSLCFGPHEQGLAARASSLLAEIFSVRPLVIPRRTTLTVEVGQTSLARLFEALCGRGAHNKQVPPPISSAPLPVMRAFLEGYLAGDGHRTATHAVALTVSERLALGLFELGLHLGMLPTYFEHSPAPTKEIEGRTVTQSKCHIVKFLRKRFDPGFDTKPERSAWRETPAHFLVPLRRIDRALYSGPVYNLEVRDPDHSYLAPFLAVANCQNWDISKSRDMDRLMDSASPEGIARAAVESGCRSVAFTYNDPVIFAEYAMDAADACRAAGILTVAVTAGYISPAPRREFYAKMDAANVDLKGFTDEFYVKLTGAKLAPVLDTLVYLRHETQVWFEITTLLIPGKNDSPEEARAMSKWIMRELGPDVPLHFTAFHPDFKMTDLAPTPAATLTRARRIAMDEGLRYVYTGNVHDREGGTTFCPGCGTALIVRDWHRIEGYRLTPQGKCPDCSTQIPGRFEAFDSGGQWGRKRVPIHLSHLVPGALS